MVLKFYYNRKYWRYPRKIGRKETSHGAFTITEVSQHMKYLILIKDYHSK
jgi:hypothetical protein